MKTKTCSGCKEIKPVNDFKLRCPRNKNSSTLQAFCVECNRSVNKKWYKQNKSKHLLTVKANRERYRNEVDDYLDSVKTKPCADCNKVFHPWIMEFDHVDDNKVTGVAQLRRLKATLESIKREVAKCQLVCANCHRARTFGRACKKSLRLQTRYSD